LSPEEFYALAPSQFGRLCRAWQARERRWDQRFALIACVIANVNRGADDEPFDIRDFMPLTENEREELEREKNRVSQQRMAAALVGRPGFQPGNIDG
jgi:hypothetical protein